MNNVLIGLPDLAKERKLSKIVINRRLPNILMLIKRRPPQLPVLLKINTDMNML